MKKSFTYLALAGAITMASCTNLEESIYGVIPQEGFGNTPEQLAALLGPAYSNVRDASWNWHNHEVTTDVMLVPTRGADWYDGGNWLNYHRHTWSTLHGPINDMWGWIFEGGINTINQLIPQVEGNAPATAELRAVRAFYYLLALDLFGNVPIITESGAASAATKTRAEVYAFVETELTAALPNLSEAKTYGRINKWAAQALLAKLYINAQVYKGSPEWAKCVAACDAVINSGQYSLESNFFNNFSINNEGSTENVWAIPFDKNQAGGMTIAYRTLHYANQATYGLADTPWNGFCSLADFYNSFENNDLRKQMFITGLQKSASGANLKDALGNDLVFTIDVPKDEMTAQDVTYQGAGARLGKYQIQTNNVRTDQDNDWAMLRLADVHLMRGEAKFRLGDQAGALADVNPIRQRAGLAPATSLTLDSILEERGRELAWEGWRRNDLVRFGKFTEVGGKFTSKFMKNPAAHTALFPIPQQRIDANPGLKQNPGY
ncbi:RagB/SusD family nutrient uptake outer membrane protein [Arundinibacter roseus]|uniref:RagB/SusD family nutrient uptake outer membrane protein n=1 Tax=Arundinibacter roseus TaxID=2070510 RepID=A0A4R4JY75_9BACT|nr:RagB/SusD family nutrient uptake outer membrane protein [Arundinibacter roseus]TDB59850.1 RagB/SusD family nutrient uptake outer membrane protein [Arundinibacter roseus]